MILEKKIILNSKYEVGDFVIFRLQVATTTIFPSFRLGIIHDITLGQENIPQYLVKYKNIEGELEEEDVYENQIVLFLSQGDIELLQDDFLNNKKEYFIAEEEKINI